MRKIPAKYENPFDNIFICIAEKLNPVYKYFNFTPNILTSISLFFGILSSYFLSINRKYSAIVLLILSYLYDCSDGSFARKYNMESQFGDYYDHISDVIKFIFIFYVLFKQNKNKFVPVLIMSIVLITLLNIHFGCQEKLYNNSNNNLLLSYLKSFCSKKSYINFTKYFGSGTFVIFIAIVMYFY